MGRSNHRRLLRSSHNENLRMQQLPALAIGAVDGEHHGEPLGPH